MSECTKIRCLHKIGMCNGQLPPCAAEAMEAAKTNTQQLKPKKPSFAEVYTEWSGINTHLAPKTDSERIIAHDIYNIIARHFGH